MLRKHDWQKDLTSWSIEDRSVRVNMALPMLEAVLAEAGAQVEVSGVLGQDLRAVASAGAALAIKGIDGAALNAGALDCATANADVASGASLIVNAHENMTLSASGGGSLTAKGGGEILRQAASYGGLIVVQP